jgi:hypothetical protein
MNNMPRFNAEASVYRTSNAYAAHATLGGNASAMIIPQHVGWFAG